MPTDNKTINLKLNSWLGTDKPTRSDFVQDNTILDTTIGNHLQDLTMHLSADDRTLLNNPFTISVFSGDGNSSKEHELDFVPKCVIVYLKSAPLSEYDSDNNYTIYNSAIVAAGGGGSIGASLSLSTLTLTQSTTATNGRFINLNKNNGIYVCIAFK